MTDLHQQTTQSSGITVDPATTRIRRCNCRDPSTPSIMLSYHQLQPPRDFPPLTSTNSAPVPLTHGSAAAPNRIAAPTHAHYNKRHGTHRPHKDATAADLPPPNALSLPPTKGKSHRKVTREKERWFLESEYSWLSLDPQHRTIPPHPLHRMTDLHQQTTQSSGITVDPATTRIRRCNCRDPSTPSIMLSCHQLQPPRDFPPLTSTNSAPVPLTHGSAAAPNRIAAPTHAHYNKRHGTHRPHKDATAADLPPPNALSLPPTKGKSHSMFII
ncbi:hypothetical protein RYX36_001204 [Vicia faba]